MALWEGVGRLLSVVYDEFGVGSRVVVKHGRFLVGNLDQCRGGCSALLKR